MTFLELCQRVARESGTVPSLGAPATVENQEGRLARIVYWVGDAWRDIQTGRSDWRWMVADFSGETLAGVKEYGASDLGINTRFSSWLGPYAERHFFTAYKTSEGQANEGFLEIMLWDDFRQVCMVGAQAEKTGRPINVAVSDADKLMLYPTPDAAYTIRGRYRKAPQELVADTDVPEMPSEFHMAIVQRALVHLALHDEDYQGAQARSVLFDKIHTKLVHSQTPQVNVGGPLA